MGDEVALQLDLGCENLGVDRLQFTIPGKDFACSASLWEWNPERQRRTRQLAPAVQKGVPPEAQPPGS